MIVGVFHETPHAVSGLRLVAMVAVLQGLSACSREYFSPLRNPRQRLQIGMVARMGEFVLPHDGPVPNQEHSRHHHHATNGATGEVAAEHRADVPADGPRRREVTKPCAAATEPVVEHPLGIPRRPELVANGS